MKTNFVQYYVEGDDEEKFVRVLKENLKAVRSGKVQKFNVVERYFSDAQLMTLRRGTMAVLVFDTDTRQTDILIRNLEKLKKCSAISEIVTVTQVLNLEDELIRSCNIKQITELLGSKSKSEFKSDFIRVNNLADKLREHKFNINLLWSKQPNAPYSEAGIKNQSQKIK